MQGYTIITESRWEVLKTKCDFFEYMGERVHRGDTYWEMEVVHTDQHDRVIYDHVLIDPKWR